MGIFKELSKKGYKHYYEGTVEELDSMDKDNQHLHSEIMQVIMWLYEKHGIWVEIRFADDYKIFFYDIINTKNLKAITSKSVSHFNSPTEAYEAAIKYCLEKII